MAEFLKLLAPIVVIVGGLGLMLRANQRNFARRAQEANEVQRDIARQLERMADALARPKP